MIMTTSWEDACEPYVFSNDYWRPSVAQHVREANTGAAENAAALVIGAGTLPYTLDVLPSTIVVADLHESVVDSVIARCRYVAEEGTSWEDYADRFCDYNVGGELREFERVGLVGDFQKVKEAAQRLTLIPLIGDIVEKPDEITEILEPDGKQLTFVNFTNVARYIKRPEVISDTAPYPGRAVLAKLLGKLPVGKDAVICDSTSALEVFLYSRDQYLAFDLTRPAEPLPEPASPDTAASPKGLTIPPATRYSVTWQWRSRGM